MVRKLITILAVSALLALTAAVAVGANPHFIQNQPNSGDPQCWYQGGNSITCSFKIAGLGNVSQVSATVEVDRTCTTKSGSNDPPGQQRSQPTTLNVTNGQVTETAQVFSFRRLQCPGQQTTTLGDAQFYIDGQLVSGGPVPIHQ